MISSIWPGKIYFHYVAIVEFWQKFSYKIILSKNKTNIHGGDTDNTIIIDFACICVMWVD